MVPGGTGTRNKTTQVYFSFYASLFQFLRLWKSRKNPRPFDKEHRTQIFFLLSFGEMKRLRQVAQRTETQKPNQRQKLLQITTFCMIL